MNFDTVAPILRAVERVVAEDQPLHPIGLAGRLGRELEDVLETLEQLEARGLILRGEDDYEHVPLFFHAGAQYLQAAGDVADEDVEFLARVVDDLHARAALRVAGTILVDQFRDAAIAGQSIEHARQLVPPAFAPGIDASLATNLFAAAVALATRLALGEPAGCLAEEILAVELVDIAATHLEMRQATSTLSESDAEGAQDALRGLFNLFEDDDVLDLFDMAEPADAAVAGHNWINQQMGKVDQRLENWFRPYSWTSETGYYWPREPRREHDSPPGPNPGPN